MIIFDVILTKLLLLLQHISVYSLVKSVYCACACLPLYAVYVRVGYVRGCLPAQPSAYVCPSVCVLMCACKYMRMSVFYLPVISFHPSS